MATSRWTSPLPTADPSWHEQFRKARSIAAQHFEGFSRDLLLALLVAAGYYIGSRVGFLLTPRATPIATFWPPNAILLAALLLAPYARWWMFLLAALPAHLLIQLSTHVPLATACGWFLSNSAEALLGAACIRHFRKTEELFETVSGVLIFLVFAVVVAPLASSFVDAGVVLTTGFGNGYWGLWTARFFSNMLAAITVAPTIIVIALQGRRWNQSPRPWRVLEAGLMAAGVVILSSFVFGITHSSIPALIFTPLPLVVWIVVRFGSEGLYPAILSISIISAWNATHGRNPFIYAPTSEGVLALQIFLCTIALPMMLLAALLAERKTAEEILRESRARLINAQEQERRRIARELHDDIGQQLTILQLEIEQVKCTASGDMKPALDNLYQQAAATSVSARSLSHALHSVHLELLGLVPALRNLCQTVVKETSIAIEFSEENVPPDLDSQASLCLYRVTQEALHNIARHSHARAATVCVRASRKWISLHIADNGIGIAEHREQASGLGLASMKERVNLVGGDFKLESGQMRGTTIEVTIPLIPASS